MPCPAQHTSLPTSCLFFFSWTTKVQLVLSICEWLWAIRGARETHQRQTLKRGSFSLTQKQSTAHRLPVKSRAWRLGYVGIFAILTFHMSCASDNSCEELLILIPMSHPGYGSLSLPSILGLFHSFSFFPRISWALVTVVGFPIDCLFRAQIQVLEYQNCELLCISPLTTATL